LILCLLLLIYAGWLTWKKRHKFEWIVISHTLKLCEIMHTTFLIVLNYERGLYCSESRTYGETWSDYKLWKGSIYRGLFHRWVDFTYRFSKIQCNLVLTFCFSTLNNFCIALPLTLVVNLIFNSIFFINKQHHNSQWIAWEFILTDKLRLNLIWNVIKLVNTAK
jgi:hypothetical protein